ncbi:hypothetical protein QP185_04415 [Sphingomonas aerolata]|uniref:hypothetical protein n=1 Tax=Sphingomonas aerolata TaxID=185951 RepID=UPI002FDF655B
MRRVAEALAATPGAVGILFYGSNPRTGATEGVLDFYVLTAGSPERGIWPTVSYREFDAAGETLRAKIATMRLSTFVKLRTRGRSTRRSGRASSSPVALVWSRDEATTARIAEAIAAAARSAARFAAALGLETGIPRDYWRALFRQTYAAEFRVEKGGREDQIIGSTPTAVTGCSRSPGRPTGSP